VCGTIYNIYSNPPRVPNVCDRDGATLIFRKDDSESAIAERLKEYDTKTLPLTEYYGQRGSLVEISGDAPPEQVTAQLLAALESHEKIAI
jgi:adenylate kinase